MQRSMFIRFRQVKYLLNFLKNLVCLLVLVLVSACGGFENSPLVDRKMSNDKIDTALAAVRSSIPQSDTVEFDRIIARSSHDGKVTTVCGLVSYDNWLGFRSQLMPFFVRVTTGAAKPWARVAGSLEHEIAAIAIRCSSAGLSLRSMP